MDHQQLLALRNSLTRRGRIILAVGLISVVGLALTWGHGLSRLWGSWGRNVDITSAPAVQRGLDLSDPEAPFIRWPLARVCRETKWTPGVVFACDNNSGGVGNIRNFILTCIRYSIEAGATGLVMPQIESRSEENLSSLFRGPKPFSYFFDEQHFRTALTASCPQIVIYDNISSIPHLSDARAEKITPKDFGSRGGCDQRDLNRHTDLFGAQFHAWISKTGTLFDIRPVSLRHPRLVRFNWGVQWDWPVLKDGPEFTNTFGGLLRFRRDILDLGKKVKGAMRLTARASGRGDRFMGLHLRTENDILKFWPPYETQSVTYLREASRRDFHTAYLATGNATEAEKFAAKASSQNRLRVVTKHELLKNPQDLKLLASLTWDQQGLVDFIVLLYSDYFVGASPSSFSINVAGKRHLKTEGLYTLPWKVGREGDGRSLLVGSYEGYWRDWLFMFDSLWP